MTSRAGPIIPHTFEPAYARLDMLPPVLRHLGSNLPVRHVADPARSEPFHNHCPTATGTRSRPYQAFGPQDCHRDEGGQTRGLRSYLMDIWNWLVINSIIGMIVLKSVENSDPKYDLKVDMLDLQGKVC